MAGGAEMEAMKNALAAKGYDLVEPKADGESDSDEDFGMPGRIQSLEPNVAREKGKKAFEQGKYDKAIRCWQGGLKSILSALCSGPEAMSNTTLSELDMTLNLNIAMAYMRKEDYEGASRSVDKALARRDSLPPNLITKALYRKAMAQRAMHRLDECLETLKDLLVVEPGHPAALQMQQEVDREWNKQKREQKKNMKKLFDKLGVEDRQEEQKALTKKAETRSRLAVKWIEGDVDLAAYERNEAPAADGKDWGLALSRTVLWALDQFAMEDAFTLGAEVKHASAWFLGASSTCELRWLQPSAVMSRLPDIQAMELVLVGFLGELDPDNKRVPDTGAEKLPKGVMQHGVSDGRQVFVRCIKGAMQDALTPELKGEESPNAPVQAAAQQPVEKAADGDASTDAAAEAAAPASGASDGPAVAEASESLAAGAEEPSAEASAAAPDASSAPVPQQLLSVLPTVCFICHPQLHRYFSDFFPAISWLIRHNVPTVVIGASEPDPSWKQDEILLKALGANIVVGKRESPYPMCLPNDTKIKKCSHIIGFRGGKVVEKDRLTKVKLELLSQDYTVR